MTRGESLTISRHTCFIRLSTSQASAPVPLRMFVSGVGGTGKSFLIHAVKCLIDSLWSTDDISGAIAAPSGLAAFNVGGVTIHRLFQLPIEHEGKQAGYWSLSKAAQKVMRSTFRSLKMIIVDEVSMVSSLNCGSCTCAVSQSGISV